MSSFLRLTKLEGILEESPTSGEPREASSVSVNITYISSIHPVRVGKFGLCSKIVLSNSSHYIVRESPSEIGELIENKETKKRLLNG
tara:strand:+ start:52653 stop:52913 length:261 start_codon:yes stop_codon:yes gene_type:complete